MKNKSTVFLQVVILLIGIITLAIIIRLPMMEGRAVNLDLLSIYTDPFIIYGYAASTPFFYALYQAFLLLGYIAMNKVFSNQSLLSLRNIKYSALLISTLIVLAGIYIRIFHHKADDPAGFLAICFVTSLTFIVVAIFASVFEKIIHHGIDLKSENEMLQAHR